MDILALLTLLAAAQVAALTPVPVDPQGEAAAQLNRAAGDAAAGRTRSIADDQAAYQRDLAAFQEAKRRNDEERARAAAAADAYRSDRAAYEAAMTEWRRKVTAVEDADAGHRRAAAPPPMPAPVANDDQSPPICRTVREEPISGTHFSRSRRVCTPTSAE